MLSGQVWYGTKGWVIALEPDSTPRWETILTTFNFRRPLQITPSGEWIAIDDNVLQTESGELLEIDGLEFDIDQFAMGADGKTYLLTGAIPNGAE